MPETRRLWERDQRWREGTQRWRVDAERGSATCGLPGSQVSMVLFTGLDQVVSSIRQEVTGKGGVWNSGIVFQKLIIIMLTFTLQL